MATIRSAPSTLTRCWIAPEYAGGDMKLRPYRLAGLASLPIGGDPALLHQRARSAIFRAEHRSEIAPAGTSPPSGGRARPPPRCRHRQAARCWSRGLDPPSAARAPPVRIESVVLRYLRQAAAGHAQRILQTVLVEVVAVAAAQHCGMIGRQVISDGKIAFRYPVVLITHGSEPQRLLRRRRRQPAAEQRVRQHRVDAGRLMQRWLHPRHGKAAQLSLTKGSPSRRD